MAKAQGVYLAQRCAAVARRARPKPPKAAAGPSEQRAAQHSGGQLCWPRAPNSKKNSLKTLHYFIKKIAK